jgi:hypothetical protein
MVRRTNVGCARAVCTYADLRQSAASEITGAPFRANLGSGDASPERKRQCGALVTAAAFGQSQLTAPADVAHDFGLALFTGR